MLENSFNSENTNDCSPENLQYGNFQKKDNESNQIRSKLVHKMAKTILKCIENNMSNPFYYVFINLSNKSAFFTSEPPNIQIIDYYNRIIDFTRLSNSTLIYSFVLLNRLLKGYIWITEYNSHNLIAISCLIALKCNEDLIFDNQFYAKIFGIKLPELNNMEYEFLKNIHFETWVCLDEYDLFKNLIFQ